MGADKSPLQTERKANPEIKATRKNVQGRISVRFKVFLRMDFCIRVFGALFFGVALFLRSL